MVVCGGHSDDVDVSRDWQVTSLDALMIMHGRRQKAQGSVNFNYHGDR
jgi:hypothetical protein